MKLFKVFCLATSVLLQLDAVTVSEVRAESEAQQLDLRLVGTSFLDPASPLAILESSRFGKQETFQLGDEVFNVGRLVKVTKSSVVLEKKDASKLLISQSGGRANIQKLADKRDSSSPEFSRNRTRTLREVAKVLLPPQIMAREESSGLSEQRLEALIVQYKDTPVALGRDKDGALYFDPKDRAVLFDSERFFGKEDDFSPIDSKDVSTSGLLIKNIRTSSLISPLGLNKGDLLVRVAGMPIKSYEDLKRAFAKSSGTTIGVEYLSAGNRRGTEVRFIREK